MNTHSNRFFLLSGSARAGRPGFWMADFSNELCTSTSKDYADLWICTKIPQRLKLLSVPAPALSLSVDAGNRRHTTVTVGDHDLPAEDVIAVIRGLAQRANFVYAANEVAANELPVALDANPPKPLYSQAVHVLLNVKTFWDLPDVRLGIMLQRLYAEEFRRNILSKIRSSSTLKDFDPTGEYEAVARLTNLQSGLFLPATVEIEGAQIPTILRTDRDLGQEGNIMATIFSRSSLSNLKSGATLSRNTHFEYAGQREEVTKIIGVIG